VARVANKRNGSRLFDDEEAEEAPATAGKRRAVLMALPLCRSVRLVRDAWDSAGMAATGGVEKRNVAVEAACSA
jgi:hypothetical protein